ncbi:hypothetical protein SJAG_00905 [Schizosaccharomyces japonicus yFS275]|uniref:Uncharacterized protein n=1 Tax=Schizosaccharomyces japonicus (strain yFS275 / FY16936) TaxID=402676 RepID=B6JWY0_SCHJY|nr:hypothetical protein SJAG_00905 [Schizosaccharomyces japonicus yFS275]EEB05881.1 hypothetical protein SJAG_00905 [Schizosaccharomyces japonicus yFS275]
MKRFSRAFSTTDNAPNLKKTTVTRTLSLTDYNKRQGVLPTYAETRSLNCKDTELLLNAIPARGSFPELVNTDCSLKRVTPVMSVRTCFRMGELLKVMCSQRRRNAVPVVVEYFGKIRNVKQKQPIAQFELEDAFRSGKMPTVLARFYVVPNQTNNRQWRPGMLVRVLATLDADSNTERLLKGMHITGSDADEIQETLKMVAYAEEGKDVEHCNDRDKNDDDDDNEGFYTPTTSSTDASEDEEDK